MKKYLIIASLFAITQAQAQSVKGEVKKVDLEAGKITLHHAPIKNLDMDAMTMVLRIDPALAKDLKAGDKVMFDADRVNGAITVTKIKKGQ